MPMHSVFPIESPISPFQLAAYKKLRLTSLQLDPQAFSSNYAREVTFSDDAWRERVEGQGKQTIVASVRDVSHEGGDGNNKETEGV